MTAKQSALPIDAGALFQAYVDLINSERETIWARHNALLVANSLIVGGPCHQPGGAVAEQVGGAVAAWRRPPHQCCFGF